MGYIKQEVPPFIIKSTDEIEKVYDFDILDIITTVLCNLHGSSCMFVDRSKFLIDQLERNEFEIRKKR